MRVLFYDYASGHFNWIKNFRQYLQSKNVLFTGYTHKYNKEELLSLLDKNDMVFMWNGHTRGCELIKNYCQEHNKQYYIMEVGWFPQKQYFHIDNKGINADSSIMNLNLSKISDQLQYKYNLFRLQYVGDRQWNRCHQYILCPLQLPRDTNIRKHSPYKSMQLFINHVESKFLGKKILFKRHPKDGTEYFTNHKIICDGNILDYAVNAELVYGINSTSLLETAMLGVPTIGVGNGFINKHNNNLNNLLAILVDRQIPINSIDLDYWLKNILK